jgi:hypothetical protein
VTRSILAPLLVSFSTLLATSAFAQNARTVERAGPAGDDVASPQAASASASTKPPPKRDDEDMWPVSPCSERRDGKSHAEEGCAGVLGLRGAYTRGVGPGSSDGFTLSLSSEGEDYGRRGFFTNRSLHRLGIGGGTAGFDGALMGSFTAGVRAPVGEWHGPIARVGFQGYILGNDAFYGSLLELPRLEVGYQIATRDLLVELGGSTGVALVGRYRAGDAYSRHIGNGFDLGAYAAIQGPWVRLGISWLRMPTHDEIDAPVDVAEGTLCLVRAPFALCGDGRAMRTRAAISGDVRPSVDVRTFYAGITIGFTREK